MNKKAWYWIGAVVIVIIIIVIATRSSSTSVPSQPTAAAVKQTIHDLIASGATQTCTFSIAATASTSSMSGTVYMASGNMRGDFVTTNPAGKVTNAYMIIASGMDYLWTDASANKGVKMLWSVAASSTALLNKQGGIDVDQPTVYSCTNATPDQSKFVIPTDIQFTDISALLKSRNSAGGASVK